MKNIQMIIAAIIFVAPISLASCKKSGQDAQLSLANQTDSVAAWGGTKSLMFNCNSSWGIDTTGLNWVKLSQVSGDAGNATIQVAVSDTNYTGAARSKVILLNSANGLTRRINVYQFPYVFPNYNTSPKAPDATGMSSTAAQLITKIKLGVNLGNTLELVNINPGPTENYFKLLKQTGFNAVRIPAGWYLHGGDNATAQIPQEWMDSVKKVVQMCVDNDMYVLLNIHWDGGWLEGAGNAADSKKDMVIARQTAYWQQIATAMRDFDEHVLFASANEPFNVSNDAEAKNLVAYHQACINAVRSTGGKNAYRTIAIQGSEEFIQPGRYFPTDATPNRLLFEFHNYTPSNFAILDADPSEGGWGNIFYYWGAGNHSTIDDPFRNATYGEEADQLAFFKKMKTEYIDKGVPLIMGEYSTNRRKATDPIHVPRDMAKHNASVNAWYTYLTKQCLAIGAKPFVWETGGVFDRVNDTIKDQQTVDAIKAAL
ncbi:cellulase family glycosylhydrolase [Pinibacter aurantiacus]|uniref:Cellulase family glycosylhydrolase n=1 Tax=Pinibacter aurantiacus TaxID=2851599 RepID=A0A9E2SC15_9BACT|nr:cellulase family glycosylhydrolase [Pinibacter aurantiacus]MBV4358734.1 cellulase family glycosylhydrolase [Pinibacter aurantiacus]